MPLIYLDFELRRDYIVKNLCENRNRPQLNCNGKCYLAKKIAVAQENEQQQKERNFISQLCETLAAPKGTIISIFSANTSPVHIYPIFSPYISSLNGRIMISGIFHPPLAA